MSERLMRNYYADDVLYRKLADRHYEQVALFDGWPAEGVHLVETIRNGRGHSTGVRSTLISPLPTPFTATRAALERRRDDVWRNIERIPEGTMVSWQDLISRVFDALSVEGQALAAIAGLGEDGA